MRPENCRAMRADRNRTIRLKFERPTAVKAAAVLSGRRRTETAYRTAARPKTITWHAKPVRQDAIQERHVYAMEDDGDAMEKTIGPAEPVYDYESRNDAEYYAGTRSDDICI